MRTGAFIIFLLSSVVPASFAGRSLTIEEKLTVSLIVSEIQEISKSASSLEYFGTATMTQSRDILELGPACVYTLSYHLEHNPDWKVRFWIVDMFGYLANPDAARALQRVLNDANEKECVRERARASLQKLPITAGFLLP